MIDKRLEIQKTKNERKTENKGRKEGKKRRNNEIKKEKYASRRIRVKMKENKKRKLYAGLFNLSNKANIYSQKNKLCDRSLNDRICNNFE